MKQNNKEKNTGSKAIANQAIQKKQNGKSLPSASFIQLKEDTIQKVEEEETLQGKFDTAQLVEEEEPLQGKFNTLQMVEEEDPLQGKFEADQKQENKADMKIKNIFNLK